MTDTGAVQVMRAWNPCTVSKTASIADTAKTAKTSPKIPPAPFVVGKESEIPNGAKTNDYTPPNRRAGSPLRGGEARGRSRIRSTVPPLRILQAVVAPPPFIDVHARLRGSLISTSQPCVLVPTPNGGEEAGNVGGGKPAAGGGARPSPREVEPSSVERLGSYYSPAAQGLFVDSNRGSIAWRQMDTIHNADSGGSDNGGVGCRLLSSRGAFSTLWRGERSRPGVRTEADRRVVSSVASADVSGREEEGPRLARRAASAPATKRFPPRMLADDDGDRPGTTVERFAGDDDAPCASRVRGRGTGISDTCRVRGGVACSSHMISASAQGALPDTATRRSSPREEGGEEKREEGHNYGMEGRGLAASWTTEWGSLSEKLPLETSSLKWRIPPDGAEHATPRPPSSLLRGCGDRHSPTLAVGERWRMPLDELPRAAPLGRSYSLEKETEELRSEGDDTGGRRYYSSSIATTAIVRGADDAVAGGSDERLEPGSERYGKLLFLRGRQ